MNKPLLKPELLDSAIRNLQSKCEVGYKQLAESKAAGKTKDYEMRTFRKQQVLLSIEILKNPNYLLTRQAELLQWMRSMADHWRAELNSQEYAKKEKQATRIKRFTSCSKAGCYGRGYSGFNIETGEVTFCDCILQDIELYVEPIEKASDEQHRDHEPAEKA